MQTESDRAEIQSTSDINALYWTLEGLMSEISRSYVPTACEARREGNSTSTKLYKKKHI